MLDHFCSQLVKIQTTVAGRPDEERLPTPYEVEMQRKLLNCIIRMKDYPMETFKTLAWGIAPVSDEVFTSQGENEAAETEEILSAADAPLTTRFSAFGDEKTYYDVNKSGKNGETWKSGNETAQIIDNELNEEKPGGSKSGNSATKAATKTALKKPRILAKSTLKTDTEQPAEPPYQRKKNIVLASGVRWVQKAKCTIPL